MSGKILKSILTSDQVQLIRTLLFIKPKEDQYSKYGANQWYSFRNEEEDTKKPIIFYMTDELEISLPYIFYWRLLGKRPNQDKVFIESKFKFQGTLRDYQIPLVQKAIYHLNSHGTTLFAVFPGAGKTVMSAYVASLTGVLPLVVYHRTNLGVQWENTFTKYTNAKVFIVGRDSNYEKLKEEGYVILSMDGQFEKIPKEFREKIGLLIIDECHRFCTQGKVGCLLGCQPKYVLGCSATPFRSDGLFSMMEAIIGTSENWVNKPLEKDFHLVKLVTGITPPQLLNRQGKTNWQGLTKWLCESDQRNQYIIDMINYYKNNKILILSWSVTHCKLLCSILTKLGKSASFFVGSMTNYTEGKILLGSLSKLSEGFDQESSSLNFDGIRFDILLLVGTTKSESLITQIAGRVLRSPTPPSIVVFIDNHKSVENHWKAIRGWAVKTTCLSSLTEMSMQPQVTDQQINNNKLAQLMASQLSLQEK